MLSLDGHGLTIQPIADGEFDATFLSVWLIYVSIRTLFAPERGPALASWTERVVYYSQVGMSFPSILRYAIAYFQKYQQLLADSWYDVDAELVAIHFALGQRPTLPVKSSTTRAKIPLTQRICENYSNESGCRIKDTIVRECLRKHICLPCEEPHHKAFERTNG
jgi:hypothetical protein